MYIESLTDGTQLYVTPGCSIQAAVDAASEDDNISVAIGIYPEYVHITKDGITLTGAGIDQTIIDLDGLAPYVHYGSAAGYCVAGLLVTGHGYTGGANVDRVTGVTIEQLTVRNAGRNAPWVDGDDGWRDGNGDGLGDVSGIEFDAAYSNTVRYCKVDNSTNQGIYFNRPIVSPRWHCMDVIVENCTSTNNYGTGIAANFAYGDFSITHNTVSGNYKNGIYAGGSKKDTGDNVYYKFATGDISYNEVHDNSTNEASQGGIHLKKYARYFTIEHNNVTGHNLWDEAFAIMLEGHSTHDNTVTLNTLSENVRGIVVFGAGGVEGGSHAPEGGCHTNFITNNMISTGAGTLDPGQAAIKVDGGYNLTISDNAIHCEGVGIRIMQSEWSASTAYDNTVSGNTITDAMFAGIRLDGGALDNTFTNNIITGTTVLTLDPGGPDEITQGDGVFIEDDAGTGNVFSGNSIYDNAESGMDNALGTTVDASGNWWGDLDPTDDLSGSVDYSPWLAVDTDTSGDPGFQGDFSELWVDDDSPQAGAAGIIQEGIDLVSGSIVNVLPGTYPGSIVFSTGFDTDGILIDGDDASSPVITGGVRFLQSADIDGIGFKDLVLKGIAPGGNSIIDFDNSGAVNNFSLVDCVLDGEGVADRYGLTGNKLGQSLTVTGCEIKDILGWAVMDFDSSYSGPPIGGNELPLTTVTFAGNHVHECNGSIALRGNHVTRTVLANVYDNVFENIGGNAGEPGQHWAGLELNHVVTANIYGNTMDGVVEGEWGEGQAFQLWDIGTLDFHANIITNNYEGLFFYDGSAGGAFGGPYAIPAGAVECNAFVGNTQYGIKTGPNCTGGPLDAEMNWWGDPSGPAIARGTGDKALGDIDFDPWIGKAGGENIVCDPDPEYLTAADPTKTIAVKYLGGGSDAVFGYSIKFSWDSTIVGTSTGDVSEGALLSDLGGTFFYAAPGTGDEIVVDCALLGSVTGATGPGTLFTIDFTGLAVGTSDIDVTILNVRDEYNNPLSGFYEDDGLLSVDISVPTIADVEILNTTLAHTDDYIKDTDAAQVTATVLDDDPAFGAADITADLTGLGGGAAVNPGSYNWTTGLAIWMIVAPPGVACNPANGTVTVTVDATDAIGNPAAQGSDDIIADNVAPTVVTDFDAAPGHQKCDLSWTMGTDLYPAGVVVQRDDNTGDYPLYVAFKGAWPNVDAFYPGSELLGTNVYNGVGTSTADAVVDRNIYYYQAFCYDEARNYGLAASTARDLATNYWLGDVAAAIGVWGYNGLVNDADIDKLGGAYYAAPAGSPENEMDVGPTVHPSYNRLGLPMPDDLVGFEDLMIFAMNYGVVSARVVPLLTEPTMGDLALLIEEIGRSSDGTVELALRLVGNMGEVKGVSAALTLEGLEFVSARLSDEMDTPAADIFFWHGERDGVVQIDLAMLGTDMTIGGSGDLVNLAFRATADVHSIEFESASLRGAENEDLDADLAGYGSGDEVPMVFRLVQNAPNPFNPLTTIAYEVPQTSAVTITVYDVSGRLVTTLVDGTVDPGRYSAVWDGRNDHGESVGSGVYFCVMETPNYRGSHKMVLMK